MYVVYSTKVTGSKTGLNANRDVRTLYGWSDQREREGKREKRMNRKDSGIHEMCRGKCRLHGTRFHV